MATTTALTVAALVLALAACCGVSAPSPAPESATAPSPASNGCFTALLNMSDCLSYVQDGSNQTKSDKGCCPELAGLVDSNPICLCQLLGNPDSLGIKIDLKKALKLPSVCGVTTPPVSTCSAIGVPVSLPPSESTSRSLPPEGPTTSPPNGAAAPGPGGLSPSAKEAAGSPSRSEDNDNRASGIQASSLTFICGLATFFVSIFF